MNKIFIGYLILIVISLVSALIGVMKRKAMLSLSEINYFSPKFWIITLFNPSIIMIFCISILMFILTLAVCSFATADDILVVSWTLVIPEFLLIIFLNSFWLSEKINVGKYPYIAVLFISVIIGIFGAVGYFRN